MSNSAAVAAWEANSESGRPKADRGVDWSTTGWQLALASFVQVIAVGRLAHFVLSSFTLSVAQLCTMIAAAYLGPMYQSAMKVTRKYRPTLATHPATAAAENTIWAMDDDLGWDAVRSSEAETADSDCESVSGVQPHSREQPMAVGHSLVVPPAVCGVVCSSQLLDQHDVSTPQHNASLP